MFPLYAMYFLFTLDGHLGCLHILSFENNDAMSTGVQIPHQDSDSVSF